MTASQPLVVGLGEFLWDLLPAGKQPGGAPANFAGHVSQLGGRGVIVTAVGDDALGSELLDWLHTIGLGSEYIQTHSSWPTGTVSVGLDPSGQPRFVIHENVAWDHLQWRPELAALASQADCVCVGTLAQRSSESRQTIQQFLTATRADCLRVFDLNLRQRFYDASLIDGLLRTCGVFKLNDEEWPVVAELAGVDPDILRGPPLLLAKYKLRLIALTRGSRGSLLVTADGVLERPGSAVEVVDTVGAGDAFTAALAVGLLRGGALEAVHRHADAVARFVCTQAGATPRLPRELVDQPTGSSRPD